MTQELSGKPGPQSQRKEYEETLRNSIGKTIQALEGWFQNAVAANQTNIKLNRAPMTGANFGVTKWVAPSPGSLVLVWVKSDTARTAGTLTVEVLVNNTATGLKAVLDGTNTTFQSVAYNEGLKPHYKGDEYEIRISTAAGWLPVTANIVAGLRVILTS